MAAIASGQVCRPFRRPCGVTWRGEKISATDMEYSLRSLGGLPGPGGETAGRAMTTDRGWRRSPVSVRWRKTITLTRQRAARKAAGDMAGRGGASSSLCVCPTEEQAPDGPAPVTSVELK